MSKSYCPMPVGHCLSSWRGLVFCLKVMAYQGKKCKFNDPHIPSMLAEPIFPPTVSTIWLASGWTLPWVLQSLPPPYALVIYNALTNIHRGQLQGILAFTTPNKVLYNSDFPYCSLEQVKHFTDLLDTFVAKDAKGKSLENLAESARALFGW
jgi:hypothetical protein